MAFRKIKAGLVKADVEEFVGEPGNLFFDIDDGALRISDGATPGGFVVSSGAGGGNYTLPTASASIKGGVKIGANISIDAGVISVAAPFSKSYNDLTNKPALFSGSYADLTNKPSIPTVPTTVSSFSNDAGYLTSVINITGNAGTVTNGVYTTGSYANPTWITSLAYSKLTGAPNLFSGSYSDLTNKPTIPSITGLATETFVTSQGYITSSALTGYALTSQIPTAYTLPTASASVLGGIKLGTGLSIDANGVVNVTVQGGGGTVDLTGYATETYVTTRGYLTTVDYSIITGKPALFSGSYTDLTNKPALFSGSYADLTSKPTLVTSYTQLTDKPTLFSGSYADLTNKPTLVTSYTQLTDLPTLFSGSYTDLTSKPTLFSGNYTDLTNKPVLFSGSYSDLTNKPTLITSYTQLTDKPALFSGSYTDLTSKPTLVTSYTQLTDLPTLFSGSYNDLSNKPTLFSGSYSDLTNRPVIPSITGLATETFVTSQGYITSSALTVYALSTAIPTNNNQLTNGAGYITSSALTGLATETYVTTRGYLTTVDYSIITNKPTLFSGSYTDLTSKPTLVTSYTQLTDRPTLFSGSYTDLTNKPTIPAAQIQSDWSQTTNTALDYIKNKPALFSGSYTDLTNKPTLVTSYNSLTDLPDLTGYATVTGEETLTNKTLTSPNITNGVFQDTFTIGNQIFYEHGYNGFSVNEDFDIVGENNFTGYHYTSGAGREGVAFTLARTGQFTTGFGIHGTASNNEYVIGSETTNTDFVFKNNIGMPFNVSGGTEIFRISKTGVLTTGSGESLQTIATESYVTTQGYITSTALTGLATETFVTSALSSAGITISETAPTGLSNGALWYNSRSLELYVRYDNTWVATSAGFSGNYNDLTNKPTNLSQFTNDQNFTTRDEVYAMILELS